MPSRKSFPFESVLFYDSILTQNADFKKWAQGFRFKWPLQSGESLKTIESYQDSLVKLSKADLPHSPTLTFVAVGGGSIGDFVGFLASTYLRGRPLIHIPSTWLSAFDSAHGGKNGLNLLTQKNQIGTFYPAEKIYLVRQLLNTQPSQRRIEALGEVIKISIIGGAKIFSLLEKNIFKLNEKMMFQILPAAIDIKNKIVQKDPFEKQGLRRVLNLGHTMGHVFESHYGWPHGICILLGTLFSVRWSYHLGLLTAADYIRISNLIEATYTSINLRDDLEGLTPARIKHFLLKDKKRTASSEIDFIFIKKVGKVIRKKVTIEEILQEVQRQKTEY